LTIDERRRPLRGWGGDPDDPFNAQMDVASASAAIVFRDILCSDDYEDDDAVPIFIALFPDSSEFRAGIKKFKSNLNHQKSFHFVPFRRGRVAVAVATAMDEATAETAALFNAFDNAMTDGLNDLKQAISSPDLRESSGSSLTENAASD
jgi:hypothetical protein